MARTSQWLLGASIIWGLTGSAWSAQTQVAVGGLEGKADVTNMGAATYTIPLSVPPGVAGATPQISLGYTSAAKVGLPGLGWNIGGLSSISRCPKTKVIDGVDRAITFDAGDKFCLDGQRLILRSGVYGSNGAEYTTEINNFSRITSKTNPDNAALIYFTVETKDGRVLEYGRSLTSVVIPNATGKSGFPLSWLKSSEYSLNQKGKLISYDYDVVAAKGQITVKSIKYAYDAQNLNPLAEIKFTYSTTANYAQESYLSGHKTVMDKRLDSISVWGSTATGIAATELTRYLLAYSSAPMTNAPKLDSVKQCSISGANLDCLAPVTFSYPESSVQMSQRTQLDVASPIDSANSWKGDFDGDGVQDIAVYSAGAMTLYSETTGTYIAYSTNIDVNEFDPAFVKIGDFNGDGKSDILSYKNNGFTLYFLEKKPEDRIINFSPMSKVRQIGISSTGWSQTDTWVGDFNGDGRDDLLTYDSLSTPKALKAWYSLSSGGFSLMTVYNLANLTSVFFPGRMWIGDFNRDGRSDVLGFDDGSMNFLTAVDGSSAPTFTVNTQVQNTFSGTATTAWTGDFNGDGARDILVYNSVVAPVNSLVLWYIGLDGKWASKAMKTFAASVDVSKAWPGDFNGDGVTDLLISSGSSLKYYISGGTNIMTEVAQTVTTPGFTLGQKIFAGDFSGDGRTDLLGFTTTAGQSKGTLYLTRNEEQASYLLRSIDTYSGTTGFYYQLLKYRHQYPVVLTESNKLYVVPPMYVVAQQYLPNGVGGQQVMDYNYSGLAITKGGRGIECFQDVIIQNLTTGQMTMTSYYQGFPYTGMINRQLKRCLSAECNAHPTYNEPDTSPSTFVDSNSNIVEHFAYVVDAKRENGIETNVATGAYQQVHFPFVKGMYHKEYTPPVMP